MQMRSQVCSSRVRNFPSQSPADNTHMHTDNICLNISNLLVHCPWVDSPCKANGPLIFSKSRCHSSASWPMSQLLHLTHAISPHYRSAKWRGERNNESAESYKLNCGHNNGTKVQKRRAGEDRNIKPAHLYSRGSLPSTSLYPPPPPPLCPPLACSKRKKSRHE